MLVRFQALPVYKMRKLLTNFIRSSSIRMLLNSIPSSCYWFRLIARYTKNVTALSNLLLQSQNVQPCLYVRSDNVY